MKYLAMFMVLVLLAAVVGVGWLYMTSTITVEAARVVAMEATAQESYFRQLKEQMASGHVIGTQYTQEPLGSPTDYQFYTYTIRLKNNTFLTADMVELQVTPMTGDVLQIGDDTARALAAHSTGDIQATILTDVNMHSVRELNITYYMWGMPFTLRTTYGN